MNPQAAIAPLPHAPDGSAMADLLQRQRADFVTAGPVPLALRRDRLRRAIELLKSNEARICEVLSADFGGRHEASSLMMDVQAPIGSLKYAHRHVARWMRPQRRAGIFPFNLFGARSELRYQPKGVVGIAGTWNGPLYMLFAPLAGVLAAGNRAMLKPSDLSPATSQWLAEAVPQFFDPLELSVVTGDLATARAFTRQAFDHLVFTGSTAVARQIMRDAADHLVPLTLELGGKSPTIIGRSAEMGQAVDRISMARAQNGGQICVMPDTVYLPRERVEEFVAQMEAAWRRMFPTTAGNVDLTAVANDRHLQRFESRLAEAAQAGARVICLGEAHDAVRDDRRRALHLVIDPPADTAIAREEIFGPAMALKPYDEVREVVAHINAGERPLALYYFGRDRAEQEFVLGHTLSGGVAVNDVMLQVGMHDVPFGGIGASGMGVYNGPEGFAEFSHLRGVYVAGWWDPRHKLGLLPPYTPAFVKMMRDAVRRA
jgi:coniferyl-aldehyde dehydrogenase